MSKRRGRKSVIHESFVAHRKEMRESPAWWALPNEARRVLDRLEIEHMRHAGGQNGKLVCTYSDFHKAGIRRSSIALAIRQCTALGFLEVRRYGYRSARTLRPASLYRLTYVNGWGDSPAPTDDWRRIADAADANARLHVAGRAEQLEKAVPRKRAIPPEIIESRPASGPVTVDPTAGLLRAAS